MTRIMGLLVTVIGVQFIIDGARPILVDIDITTPSCARARRGAPSAG
jgi:hypothetical protein